MNSLLQFVNHSSMLAPKLIDTIMDAISTAIGTILWGLCDIFFWVLDLFETLFKKFAGIDTVVNTDGGEEITGDLVLYAIKSDIVQQIFTSILVLSLFLLIIFTIFAIVKNQYSDKQEPVSKIINSSVKALLMYLLVPVAVVVCLLAGNVVLQAIDGATKATSAGSSASDSLFTAAAYNASKLREEELEDSRDNLQNMIAKGWFNNASQEFKSALESYGVKYNDPNSAIWIRTKSDMNGVAQLVDEAFVRGELGSTGIDKWNVYAIHRYYHTFRINLIIVWVGGGFLILNLGKICWGLIARLFKMTLYFAISPAVMATFPIQGDKALSAWRGEMVKNGTMAYCAVGVLNVLYTILPFVGSLEFFKGAEFLDSIVTIFIYIIAFSSAKDLVNAVSGWFGTGNAIAEGEAAQSTWKNATKKFKDNSMKAMKRVAGWKQGAETAKAHGKNAFSGAFRGMIMAGGGEKSWAEQFAEMKKGVKTGLEGSYEKGERMFGVFDRVTRKEELYEHDAEGKRIKGEDGKDKKIGLRTRIKRDGILGGKRKTRLQEERAQEYKDHKLGDSLKKQAIAMGYDERVGDSAENIEILGNTEYAQQITAPERAEVARDEAKLSKMQGFFAAIDKFAKAVEQMEKAESTRDAEIARIFKGEKGFDRSKVTNEMLSAFMSNDKDSMGSMFDKAVAGGDYVTASMIAAANDRMNQYEARKLSGLTDSYNSARDVAEMNKEEYQNRLEHSKTFKAFVDEQSINLGVDLQASETTIVGGAKKLGEALEKLADKVADAQRDIGKHGTQATIRMMNGSPSADDRKRIKDYNDSHPSK